MLLQQTFTDGKPWLLSQDHFTATELARYTELLADENITLVETDAGLNFPPVLATKSEILVMLNNWLAAAAERLADPEPIDADGLTPHQIKLLDAIDAGAIPLVGAMAIIAKLEHELFASQRNVRRLELTMRSSNRVSRVCDRCSLALPRLP